MEGFTLDLEHIIIILYSVGLIVLFYLIVKRRALLKQARITVKETIRTSNSETSKMLKEATEKSSNIVHKAEEESSEILNSANREYSNILDRANYRSTNIINQANEKSSSILHETNLKVTRAEERVDRLKAADKEITSRLKQSRSLIEDITDKSCAYAADIQLLTEEDLLSSQSYQEDRKSIKAKLKKLAINAIDNVKGSNSDVNIGRFVAISAKADMAGALLLSTVEMLCSKVTASTGHQAAEKLAETILAVETIVKCIDSRATVNQEFQDTLMKRLEIEINFKKAKALAKEQQRELREQEREEKKARQEAVRLQKEAENEERIKAEAIAELHEELATKTEAERAVYQEELDRLQTELEEAHLKMERAKSRAQETKQGHVYVISNIGSFGRDVLKIGMTRRMDPMDRVKELGDASVPYSFDVHALIESDDAPNLESTLHKLFDSKRVNKVNRRKEYFKINIDDIEQELSKLNIKALINKVPSADEYYQTLKMEELEG